MLARFSDFLKRHARVLLTTHEQPDPDGLGSLVGLAHHLTEQGQQVRMVISPELPPFLHFLESPCPVERYEPAGPHGDLSTWPDLWLLVDASEPHRLGQMLSCFEASNARKACLDHHMKDAPAGFDAEFIDPSASASAQLVAEMIYGIRGPQGLPRPMAQALYMGLVDDTGNFRFSNATPAAHRLAARLIEDGAAPARTYQQLYHQGRPQRLQIQGRALSKLGWREEGRYGRMSLSRQDMADCQASHADLEGLVNKPLEVGGVEVSALLEEREDRHIKVSLRSRERVNVQAVARRFGGGGHFLAAGARLEGPLAAAEAVLDAAVSAQCAQDLTAS